MTHYTPDEITGMIERASTDQAHAAAMLYVGEVLEQILIELQYRNGTL